MMLRVCSFFCLTNSKTLCVLEKGLYTRTLYKLVSASYLKPSTILSHLSPRDKAIQYEAEEKRKIAGFPTAKELRQAKEVAKARLKREEEEAEKIGLVGTVV
jgi:DNA-directed RNA polymerase III subunit RPC3